MKSIKPGRGPSMMSGITGIFMIGFGILWTILAAQASGFVALFGVLWTAIAIITTIYNFKNATTKNRFSTFDITDSGEESDPLNGYFGGAGTSIDAKAESESRYCPYCGSKVEGDFKYCNQCGRELP